MVLNQLLKSICHTTNNIHIFEMINEATTYIKIKTLKNITIQNIYLIYKNCIIEMNTTEFKVKPDNELIDINIKVGFSSDIVEYLNSIFDCNVIKHIEECYFTNTQPICLEYSFKERYENYTTNNLYK